MLQALMILLAICVTLFVIGLYLRWFRLSAQLDDSESSVIVTVDKSRIEADRSTLLDKVKPASRPDHD